MCSVIARFFARNKNEDMNKNIIYYIIKKKLESNIKERKKQRVERRKN